MNSSPVMTVDLQSFQDLEVFSGPGESPGLCQIIDKTRTKPGALALRLRLRIPSSCAKEIDDLQESLRFLHQTPHKFLFESGLIEAVDRYLNSRLEVCPGNSWLNQCQTTWFAFRNPAEKQELRQGTTAAQRLIIHCEDYLPKLIADGPGEYLANRLRKAVAMVRELKPQTGDSTRAIFHNDQIFRSRGAKPLTNLLALVADLDALTAMAQFGAEEGYIFPEVDHTEHILQATNLRHPLLETPVGNPASFTPTQNTVFLTGPNMAGKTTYLKSLGLALILAQCGMRVPAEKFTFSPVEHLITGMGNADNISAGISYYLAEVRRIREMAQTLTTGSPAMALIDEPFKGTNVKDASEATRQVVEACAGIKTAMFVFSSHLADLSANLEARGVTQKSFAGQIEAGELQYSYQLQDGPSSQRLGLALLEREGVLDLLRSAGQ